MNSLQRLADQGDTEAQARVILRRMRYEGLDQKMVKLAAACGHEPSRVVSWPGWADSPDNVWPLDERGVGPEFSFWVEHLTRWGQPVLCRAAIAASREAYWRWLPNHMIQAHDVLRVRRLPATRPVLNCCGAPKKAIQAAEDWVLCPCDFHFQEWTNRSQAQPIGTRWTPWAHGYPAERCREITNASDLAGEQEVREAIQRELISWALGEGDPIREGVEGRRG